MHRAEYGLYPPVAALALLALTALFAACGTSDETTDDRRVDSESHWLLACASDADCGSDLQCWCGACTRACSGPGEDCDDGVACVPADDLQPTAACHTGETSAPSGSSGGESGALPAVPGAFLCLPACSADADCDGRRCGEVEACLPPDAEGGRGAGGGSGELVCDEEEGFFWEGEECAYCDVLASRHVQRVISTMPEDLSRCDAPCDSCIATSLGFSECRTDGASFGCSEVLLNSSQIDALRAHENEVAEQTCLAPGSTWQGCQGWWKWTCDEPALPTCAAGVCVDAYTSDVPHVRSIGGPGDTHDRLPMIWTPDDATCTGEEIGTLSLCEWLATMDGLLIGELTNILPVRDTRPERGQAPMEDTAPTGCPAGYRLAIELEISPIARFGQARPDEVARVTIGPDDARFWVPQPRFAPTGWSRGTVVWGGIPDDVPERAADMLHAGTGRLMPGQTLVLPIVAGEPDPQGEVRYGLGGHLFGLYASETAGGPASRVLFQRSTDCAGPYRFGEAFRELPPADFLAAVENCPAEGLPDNPGDVRLPATPLPPEAFDSLCVSTP